MSFFRYPGGKGKLAKLIISKLLEEINKNENLEFREPFFGGGSIGTALLQQKLKINSWINDKDVGIACLWTSVLQQPEEFKNLVKGFKPSVNAFYKFKSELLDLKKIPEDVAGISEIGFKKFAIHQISYSGLGTKSGGPLGGAEQKSKYKIDCRWSPTYVCKKIDKMHVLLQKNQLRGNCCTSLDFETIIKDNRCKALLYLDPPYYIKGGDLYQNSFSLDDHIRLANSLRQTKHKWLLSYDDCEEIRNLYSWASIESIDVNYTITALKDKETGMRLARTKPELLITPK